MPYLGLSPTTGENNSFRILDDISSYTLTFDGSSSSVVSNSDETITENNHRFVQGQRVTYTNGGGANIGGLTTGSVYYIIRDDKNNIIDDLHKTVPFLSKYEKTRIKKHSK